MKQLLTILFIYALVSCPTKDTNEYCLPPPGHSFPIEENEDTEKHYPIHEQCGAYYT